MGKSTIIGKSTNPIVDDDGMTIANIYQYTSIQPVAWWHIWTYHIVPRGIRQATRCMIAAANELTHNLRENQYVHIQLYVIIYVIYMINEICLASFSFSDSLEVGNMSCWATLKLYPFLPPRFLFWRIGSVWRDIVNWTHGAMWILQLQNVAFPVIQLTTVQSRWWFRSKIVAFSTLLRSENWDRLDIQVIWVGSTNETNVIQTNQSERLPNRLLIYQCR